MLILRFLFRGRSHYASSLPTQVIVTRYLRRDRTFHCAAAQHFPSASIDGSLNLRGRGSRYAHYLYGVEAATDGSLRFAGLIGRRHVEHCITEATVEISCIVDPTPTGENYAQEQGLVLYKTVDELLNAREEGKVRIDGVILAVRLAPADFRLKIRGLKTPLCRLQTRRMFRWQSNSSKPKSRLSSRSLFRQMLSAVER